ncbi:bifunctional epoxide hydrolase 2 isoform X2 [Hyaena hyaena]|uniref:bifunctional epoxide hydrolase 2 isoform X2 n=1 Tax=Hyaena hyaena TaxID=95912 RepID=UPI0019213A49|nr:bifunctional epoxide hydrolase 2 isoform X2 [Hyaena hyaena]
MALRAAVFDLDGVLAVPSLASAFGRAEEELALPRGFLNEAFRKGGPDGSSARLMRGEITYSQWVPLMTADCRKCSEDSGIRLPENFSVNQIFGKAAAVRKINHPMLQAALALRKQGYTTCILTNNWLDDSAERGTLAQLMCELRPHFDFLIESCRIRMAKPDPQIYKFLLDTLKASPSEVVFLDDIGANLKPACDLGMVTILVHDTDTALRVLEKVTGMQLLQAAAALPILCNPSDVSHGYVPIKPGVRMHFVELGSGPAVCLCHGFPESWFSWRYQIPALAQAGFRVLALDMKGYGESSAPPEIEEYSLEVLCKEMVTFLDKLGITQAVFIGHDWGGLLVWTMALFYPERVRAVASLNTPFIPADPRVPPMERIKANPVFDYQLYFQAPGVAEAELEQNLNRTFKSFFRASDEWGMCVCEREFLQFWFVSSSSTALNLHQSASAATEKRPSCASAFASSARHPSGIASPGSLFFLFALYLEGFPDYSGRASLNLDAYEGKLPAMNSWENFLWFPLRTIPKWNNVFHFCSAW